MTIPESFDLSTKAKQVEAFEKALRDMIEVHDHPADSKLPFDSVHRHARALVLAKMKLDVPSWSIMFAQGIMILMDMGIYLCGLLLMFAAGTGALVATVQFAVLMVVLRGLWWLLCRAIAQHGGEV